MADQITIDRAVVQQALSWILYTRRFLGIDEPKEERALRAALAQAETLQDLIPPDSLFVCDQMGAHVTRVRLAQQAEPVEAAQKSGEFRVMVCGVDCHPGDQHCNGYCTGKTDDPPEATAEQAEAFAATQNRERPSCDECGKSKADGWALYCVECLEKVFTAPPPPQQAEPVQRKPLTEDEIHSIAAQVARQDGKWIFVFTRAIEQAHGIKEKA